MRFARALLVAWCFGSVAGGCTSDLKLSLDNLRCNSQERCSSGYVCDRKSKLCVRNIVGEEPVFPGPDAGDAGGAIGGTGSGGMAAVAGNAGIAGNSGGAGAGGSAGLAGQGGAGGAANDPDGGPDEPVDAGDACAPTIVYRDADNDGFGDEDTSKRGCPGNGWVVDGTDCRDDISDVNPGQTGFFGVSYFTPTGPSFDYNCSDVEEPSPDNVTNAEAPDCAGLVLTCNGSGFLSASDPARTGPGVVDPRCGSNVRRDCRNNGLGCESVDTEVGPSLTFLCH